MKGRYKILLIFLLAAGCKGREKQQQAEVDSAAARKPMVIDSTISGQAVKLPPPFATKSADNHPKVTGWPTGRTPEAPKGFTVEKFADSLKSPRWLYVLPNGDVLAALANTGGKGMGKSANIIVLFHLSEGGAAPRRDTFLSHLNQPFGMLVINGYFYVANTDGVWRYPYRTGQSKIAGPGQSILPLPPAGYNHHWTRNIISKADGSKLYVTVGSGSNNAEHGMAYEDHRANILECNPDGSGERVFAGGLRNPIGLGWAPGTTTLWAAVNERDELGDDLVPDYLTHVEEGGFYGWPYSYYGQHVDPRIPVDKQKPELVKKAIMPDVPLGAHTASIGLAFYTEKSFPKKYQGGAFIGQHGSWNRSTLAGYKVVFMPFNNSKPSGPPEDFLTGFIANGAKSEVYGRPVGLAVLPDGSLLVADDAGGVIWRVRYTGK
jgi:glucose/arabinose dehydrogenase